MDSKPAGRDQQPEEPVLTDRWQHLVAAAFRMDQAPSSQQREQAIETLSSVLEVFPESLDPMEDLEGYAVRRLAKSLLRVVEEATSTH